ncbi:hypothetical protein ACI65C_006268 [Semiaphis heraclei]
MFTNLKDCNEDLVNIKELDSAVLQLLINYIYTGEILVTKEYVKVILVLGWSELNKSSITWYDPATNIWKKALDMKKSWMPDRLTLIENKFVFGTYRTFSVGGYNYIDGGLNSSEVFNVSIQERRLVSNMSCCRRLVGVGVLNNLLYAVRGFDSSSEQCLKSVECYDPSIDTWTLVAELSVGRASVGIGILDGVIFAVGGFCNGDVGASCKSVETYATSTGVWNSVADMHFCRINPVVVALDGLLYVMGGSTANIGYLDSIEIYNPRTNTWKLIESSINYIGLPIIRAAIVFDKIPYFKTN